MRKGEAVKVKRKKQGRKLKGVGGEGFLNTD